MARRRIRSTIITIVVVAIGLALGTALGLFNSFFIGQLTSSGPNSSCKAICTSAIYTCENKVRTAVEVEFFNGTETKQKITLYRKITNQFGEIEDNFPQEYSPQTGNQFTRKAIADTVFEFSITGPDGQELEKGILGAANLCQPDDAPPRK